VRLEWTVTSGSEPVVEALTPENGEVTVQVGQVPAFLWP